MIETSTFKNQTVAVLGLARSGLAAAKALLAGGARVLAWDDAAQKRNEAAAAGIPIADLTRLDVGGIKALILSPGIPPTHAVVALAASHDVAVIGDIELLARTRPRAKIVGLTGTNGKSTTTSLIGHILKEAGREVAVGGNLGPAAMSLPMLDANGVYVLELSSYQLELTHSLAASIGVLLNLTPDHLDRHGSMDAYITAKRRLFDLQSEAAVAILGVDDQPSRDLVAMLREQHRVVIPISGRGGEAAAGGVYAWGTHLIDDLDGKRSEVLDLKDARTLPGAHNAQNAAAAYAAARCLGLETATIIRALLSFPGLAHRQELIATIEGVRYINDSKATNADAAAKALACYDAIYWIAGGRPKTEGIESLAPFFERIRHAFLIGEAAPAFARTLEGKVPASQCGTLEVALAAARNAASSEGAPNAVVLLSPACASFDQFSDFEARGSTFRRLVLLAAGRRK
ncbi:MAG TPA: UDP-N-acetylmuramoyl-L-alanine--D-glutamate ligase [Stellaceae bacterium]|nr:UDP-N-acetylmuramoyl-L-alanine--D-glutamate ligase [Stellaceae bacterium]